MLSWPPWPSLIPQTPLLFRVVDWLYDLLRNKSTTKLQQVVGIRSANSQHVNVLKVTDKLISLQQVHVNLYATNPQQSKLVEPELHYLDLLWNLLWTSCGFIAVQQIHYKSR